MVPFRFLTATDERTALDACADPSARFLAGGTTVIDLMKLHVERPETLVDVNRLPLDRIEERPDGGLRVGALVRNSDMAHHPLVRERYPVLCQALLSGASGQIRNMATTGGNLLQRTRCYYFRDTASACNKREPGSGCPAIDGHNRIHAVLGGSDRCIATHPSDMCVALVALDAIVHLEARGGARRAVPLTEFYLLPGDRPDRENVLAPGELITAVDLPPAPVARHSVYLKIRDRASYAFALASAAVALGIQNGAIADARIALGGVGTRPWRATDAEDIALADAVPRAHNGFKIELAKRTLVRALSVAEAMP
jgi:xanthine dehydrogenase YagS FAD-binding subunit